MLISVLVHLILMSFLGSAIKYQMAHDDIILLEWVALPSAALRELKKPATKRVSREIRHEQSLRAIDQPKLRIAAPTQIAEIARHALTPIQHNVDFATDVPDAVTPPVENVAKVPAGPRDFAVGSPAAKSQHVESGSGDRNGSRLLTDRFRAPSRGNQSNAMAAIVELTGVVDSMTLSTPRLPKQLVVPEDELGAILAGEGSNFRGHIRLIRLKHSLSDWWQDPTAIPSFAKWLAENTEIRTDMKFAGGALLMSDPRILDAPLIIMTGHDQDITVGRSLAKGGPLTDSFSTEERAAMRKYIVERGGMLFFDDCGFNGLFAAQVADELLEIFPEYPLENIPHDHEIYRIHYQLPLPPTGGDVFWGSENKAKMSQFRYQKGITIGNRLAVVYNRKDYMCAMETAEIESRTLLRMRRSTDVHRFMTNLLIYAMRYGGNTDRSAYRP
jgi:hypothetical protein